MGAFIYPKLIDWQNFGLQVPVGTGFGTETELFVPSKNYTFLMNGPSSMLVQDASPHIY